MNGTRLSTAALGAALLAVQSASAATVHLSELFYDAAGSDDGQVFVELFGAPGTTLDGWRIEGVNGADGAITTALGLGGVIGSDGLFVVADAFPDGTTAVANADLLLDFDFQNGPDSVRLLDPLDGVVDALGYGVFEAGSFFAGEGDAAPDGSPGQSLARRFADVDTDRNASDFLLLDLPTPGAAPVSVPEPPRPALLLAALCLLGLRLRRRPD